MKSLPSHSKNINNNTNNNNTNNNNTNNNKQNECHKVFSFQFPVAVGEIALGDAT